MELEKLIREIIQLNKDMFPDRTEFDIVTAQRIIAQVVEELGEVHGVIRSYFGRAYSPEKIATIRQVSEELGDLLVTVIILQSLSGEKIEQSLRYAVEKLKRRKEKMKCKEG